MGFAWVLRQLVDILNWFSNNKYITYDTFKAIKN